MIAGIYLPFDTGAELTLQTKIKYEQSYLLTLPLYHLQWTSSSQHSPLNTTISTRFQLPTLQSLETII